MGKYGAGSPYWNRIKELMINKLGSGKYDAGLLDMEAYSMIDLMRSANMSELPEDWKRFAEECESELFN